MRDIDNFQKYIDQLIEHEVDGKPAPEWFADGMTMATIEDYICSGVEESVYPMDIWEELCNYIDELNTLSRDEKIEYISKIIEEYEHPDEVINICGLDHSDGRRFYTSVFVYSFKCPPDWNNDFFTTLEDIKIAINLEYRPDTVKPDGSNLSDEDILALLDKYHEMGY